jgi:hypothetical protein
MEVSHPGNKRKASERGPYGVNFTKKRAGLMAESKQLGLYLSETVRQRVEDGDHNFYGLLIRIFEDAGFSISLYDDTSTARHLSARKDGYSLFHNHPASHARALQVRPTPMLPFWHIEQAESRADYQVAQARFEADAIDAVEARQFFRFWRRKRGITESETTDGTVLIALQSTLLEAGPGQSISALEMIRETLAQDRFRRIVRRPDPALIYSQEEMQALESLVDDDRVAIRSGPVAKLLDDCDYVVTQNHDLAFTALLHRKPAMLFAAAEFHHICLNAEGIGSAQAFRNILARRMAYAKYFYWYLKLNSINAGASDAGEKILQSCRNFGWEI